jgi:hypothetical protein
MIAILGILENGEQHMKVGIFTQTEAKLFMQAADKRGHAGLKYRRFFVIESTDTTDEILDVTP